MYPSYRKLREAKKDCQIPFEFQSEREVRFGMQDLLDKSIQRLAKVVNLKGNSDINLYTSCGFDSVSGYKNQIKEYDEQQQQINRFKLPTN